MGIQSISKELLVSTSRPFANMKAFIILSAVIAAVMAEADPAYFYNGHYGLGGYYGGYPYAAYGAYPYAYGAYAYTGCHNAAGAAVPCAYHNVAKRSADADADAEADPQYFYSGYYGGVYPYASYGAYPCAYGAAYAYPYAYAAYTGCRNNAGAAVPCAYGHHAIAKRDAEADAAYFVSPYFAQYGFPRTYYGAGLVHTSRFG